MLPEIAPDEFAGALDSCAAGLLWEAGVEGPPIDALAVASRLGIVVAQDQTLDGRARYVKLSDREGRSGQSTIVVGPAERPEREQWAVAHEIGEHVAHRIFDALGVASETAPPTARETVANHLASCLLLPRDWFARDGALVDWDLLVLKERYVTASHELIARRMLDMPPPIVITVCDHGRVSWRRGNMASRPPRMLPEEIRVWREAHESGECCRSKLDPSVSGLETVRSWPVHEPGWRREIVRSEIAVW